MQLRGMLQRVQDIKEWLGSGPCGAIEEARAIAFGESFRPTPLHTTVLGFDGSPSDFKFDRNLNYKVERISFSLWQLCSAFQPSASGARYHSTFLGRKPEPCVRRHKERHKDRRRNQYALAQNNPVRLRASGAAARGLQPWLGSDRTG